MLFEQLGPDQKVNTVTVVQDQQSLTKLVETK